MAVYYILCTLSVVPCTVDSVQCIKTCLLYSTHYIFYALYYVLCLYVLHVVYYVLCTLNICYMRHTVVFCGCKMLLRMCCILYTICRMLCGCMLLAVCHTYDNV